MLCETWWSSVKHRIQGLHYPIDVHLCKVRDIIWDRRFKKTLYRHMPRGRSHKSIQLPPQRKSFLRTEVLLLLRLPEPNRIRNVPVSLNCPERITTDKNRAMCDTGHRIKTRHRGKGAWNQRKWIRRAPTPDIRKGPGVLSGKTKKNLARPGPTPPHKGERVHLQLPRQRGLA